MEATPNIAARSRLGGEGGGGTRTSRQQIYFERKLIIKLIVSDLVKSGANDPGQVAAILNQLNIFTPYGRIWNSKNIKEML